MAGYIQLAGYGTENIYLTDKPEITFFKTVYRRYTNFSTEPIPQLFNIDADFGERVTCTIARTADLIKDIYIVVELPSITLTNVQIAWVDKIGFQLINYIELEIGGKVIDKQYGEWLNIWNELNYNEVQKGLDKMIGDVDVLKKYDYTKNTYILYIPLAFWFCKSPGLALPLTTLIYNDVKINVQFRNIEECYKLAPLQSIQINQSMVLFTKGETIRQVVNNVEAMGIFIEFDSSTQTLKYVNLNTSNPFQASVTGSSENFDIVGTSSLSYVTPQTNVSEINLTYTLPTITMTDAYLLVNYVYLDNGERLRFIKNNHEYLIEQVQFYTESSISSTTRKFKLGFNHPCKEMVFYGRIDNLANGPLKQMFNYSTFFENDYFNVSCSNVVSSASLLLNGNEYLGNRKNDFYNLVQVYQHFGSTPVVGVNTIVFCIDPMNNVQPSGTVNFSKIDDIVLQVTFDKSVSYKNTCTFGVYVVTYNVLRIINGICGLAFAN